MEANFKAPFCVCNELFAVQIPVYMLHLDLGAGKEWALQGQTKSLELCHIYREKPLLKPLQRRGGVDSLVSEHRRGGFGMKGDFFPSAL